MEGNIASVILGVILFVAGIVLGFVVGMSYVEGLLSGPFASALQSYFIGIIIAIALMVIGGLTLLLSIRT
jgi:uncharacterized membrane protein (DUF485 family)